MEPLLTRLTIQPTRSTPPLHLEPSSHLPQKVPLVWTLYPNAFSLYSYKNPSIVHEYSSSRPGIVNESSKTSSGFQPCRPYYTNKNHHDWGSVPYRMQEWLQMQIFYNGLDNNLIFALDGAFGGALMNHNMSKSVKLLTIWLWTRICGPTRDSLTTQNHKRLKPPKKWMHIK